MELSDREKEILEISDLSEFGYKCSDIILDTYFKPDSYEKLEMVYSIIKRIILEYCKKNNYEIDENISFDLDKLLKSIISFDDKLDGFDVSLYKTPDKMLEYFYNLVRGKDYSEIESIEAHFHYANDGFRQFFTNYVPKLIPLSNKLYYELKEPEVDPTFDVFETDSIPFDVSDSDSDSFEVWDVSDFDFDGDDFEFASSSSNDDEDELSFDKLVEYLKFINTVSTLIKYRESGLVVSSFLQDLAKNSKLESFFSDKEFMKSFDRIMEHDESKHRYYFHGTQCIEDAEHILEEGLGVMSDSLTSTAYSEFSQEDLILYSRGFGGEIGRDAVVIIDVPINSDGTEDKVLQEIAPDYETHFNPSGLQGLDGDSHYIVYPENIVGFVNKREKKVVFNPNYKNYARFMVEDDETVITDDPSKVI